MSDHDARGAINIVNDIPSPDRHRWMMFVDGENLTIQAQDVAREHGVTFANDAYHRRDVFIWLPHWSARSPVTDGHAYRLRAEAVRAFYYTTLVGTAELLHDVEKALWTMGFEARVFKKESQSRKTKGVDITLATEVLSHGFRDNYDTAVLVAGDGDYEPLAREVKQLGKTLHVLFFDGKVSERLRLASDSFFRFDRLFFECWSRYGAPPPPPS